jgi:hypothetical protein
MFSDKTATTTNGPRADSPLFKPHQSIGDYLGPKPDYSLYTPELADFVEKSRAYIKKNDDVSLINLIRRRIPESYWEPKLFERRNGASFYEKIGIRFFKKYLPTSGDLVRRLSPINKNSLAGGVSEVSGDKNLLGYEFWTRKNETVHLMGGLAMAALVFIPGGTTTSILLVQLGNLLINVYPVLLQRYNRARLYNALDRRIELRQQHQLDNECETIAISMRRAQCEGLSIRSGQLWYKNPAGNNGTGAPILDSRIKRYAGLLQKVALDDQTHLYLKVNNEWINPCIALGEILDEAGVEKRRFSTF